MTLITPFLWFDSEAEEAARFYASIFPDSKAGEITRYGEEFEEVTGKPGGSVMTVEFELCGHKFIALNGGPAFKFNEAVSFTVECETQDEVDRYWGALSEGGEENVCGWLKDKFGLSWQITPRILFDYLGHSDKDVAARAMAAMMRMKKLDIEEIKRAAEGG